MSLAMPAYHHIDFLGSRRYYLTWWALAFLSGSVNIGGLLACHRTVTHVTGSATFFGLEMAEKHYLPALGMVTLPIFFLLGAMLSALLVDRPRHQGRRPRYALVMGLVFLCICVAWIGGLLGWFGVFGEALSLSRDYVLLAVLGLASGLQNALVTSASGAVVRTTHLTGLTTDLGVGLVRMMFPSADEGALRAERKSTRMRLGIIVSFIAGSTVGGFLFMANGYAGFALPACLAAYGIWAAYYLWERIDYA